MCVVASAAASPRPSLNAAAIIIHLHHRRRHHSLSYNQQCIKEISEAPTPATLQKWADHPTIGPLVVEMFKAMMSKQF